jgi:ParB/RepB/Spo0J family partition protein
MKISLATLVMPAWNSRLPKIDKKAVQLDSLKTQELSASFLAEGQLTPVEVETTDVPGQHLLVFGTRRVAAAKMAGWDMIEATVRAPSSEAERRVRNGIENVKRENLTSFEEARLCAALRDIGLKNPDIATKLGFSSGKVSNLGRAFERLPAPIKTEWERQNPIATDRFLTDLAAEKNYPTPESIMVAWDDKVRSFKAPDAAPAEPGAEPAEERTPGKRGKGKGGSAKFPVDGARLGYLLEALSVADKSPGVAENVRKWAKHLLDFVVQGKPNPPEGIPPMPAKEGKKAKREAEKDAKRAAKAADKAEKAAAKALDAANKARAKASAVAQPTA